MTLLRPLGTMDWVLSTRFSDCASSDSFQNLPKIYIEEDSKAVNFIHSLHVGGIRTYVHGYIKDTFYLHNIYSIGCITGVEA